jgi:hypothetical protein
VITADPTAGMNGVEDCGIEDSIALLEGTGDMGPVTLFHAGGTETMGSQNSAPATSAYGVGPYIRNCFADAGASTHEIRGLSLAWCKAGIIEANQIHNATYGTFQQPTNAQDVVLRNNWFKNVKKGAFFGGLDGILRQGSLTLDTLHQKATVDLGTYQNVSMGDVVLINTSPTGPFDGIVVTVTATTSSTFTFNTSITTGGPATVTAVQRAFGVTNLAIEGNIVELVLLSSGSDSSVVGVNGQDGGSSGVTQDPAYATYLFGKVVVRDNKIRYLDGTPPAGYIGLGIQMNSAVDLLVRNNVVESARTNPVGNARCSSVAYFNNQSPDGTLILGFNDDSNTSYDELATDADFAVIVGLFNRKS